MEYFLPQLLGGSSSERTSSESQLSAVSTVEGRNLREGREIFETFRTRKKIKVILDERVSKFMNFQDELISELTTKYGHELTSDFDARKGPKVQLVQKKDGVLLAKSDPRKAGKPSGR